MTKMNNKWIAICSAAIGVIYSAGYVVTDSSAQAASQTPAKAPSGQYSMGDSHSHRHWNSDHHGNDSGRTNHSSAQQSQAPSQKSSPVASSSAKYQDGTYSGSGMNRYGIVQVSVVVQNSKITSVQITNCETHYPESDIAMLPQQVVANQTWNVDIVSGATGSSEDFRAAVQNALQKAMKA